MRIRVAQRVERAMQACRIAATDEVTVLPFPDEAPDRASEFADLEVAIALNVAPATASSHRARAEDIRNHLPVTHQAIAEGRVGEFHAIVLLDMTRDREGRDLLHEAEPAIWARAGQWPSAPELKAAARHVLTRLDPKAFTRKHARERRAANVRLRVEADAPMGVLSAYLPLPDAVTVMNAVQARAEALRAAGATAGSMNPAATGPAGESIADSTGAPLGIGRLRTVALTELAEDYLTGRSGLPAPRAHGRPVEIHLAATVETVFGLADTPASCAVTGRFRPTSFVISLGRPSSGCWPSTATPGGCSTTAGARIGPHRRRPVRYPRHTRKASARVRARRPSVAISTTTRRMP